MLILIPTRRISPRRKEKGRTSKHTTLSPRRRKRDVQRPLLPAHFLLTLHEPGLPPLLLKELYGHETAEAVIACAEVGTGVELADEHGGALIDQGFELDVFDHREGQVEYVAGLGADGREEAVEEDGVKDSCEDCIWLLEILCFSLGALLSCEGRRAKKEEKRGFGYLPRTTSLTEEGSANTSIMYSGGRRCSIA